MSRASEVVTACKDNFFLPVQATLPIQIILQWGTQPVPTGRLTHLKPLEFLSIWLPGSGFHGAEEYNEIISSSPPSVALSRIGIRVLPDIV